MIRFEVSKYLVAVRRRPEGKSECREGRKLLSKDR